MGRNPLRKVPADVDEAFLTGRSQRFLVGDALRANHVFEIIL